MKHKCPSHVSGSGLSAALVGCVACLASAEPAMSTEASSQDKFCTATAQSMFRACGFGTKDDYWVAAAKCINEPDGRDRKKCYVDARDAYSEGNELCGEQLDTRLGACKAVGENRYDPAFEPQNFDPFTRPARPNAYFPLRIGYRWEYQSATQTVEVEVLPETKLIDEIECGVVRDLVSEDGQLIEATDDWFVRAKDGTVWYCGEETKDYESFAGDNPSRPELVSIDGSFKADRDDAKPGIIFPATPVVGKSYLEEFSLGNAEDVAKVLSTTYRYGEKPDLDKLVPKRLAQIMCAAGDCVVTSNYSLLEPGVFERKYYARGIGTFLETAAATGEVVQLIRCNFDARCHSLPQP